MKAQDGVHFRAARMFVLCDGTRSDECCRDQGFQLHRRSSFNHIRVSPARGREHTAFQVDDQYDQGYRAYQPPAYTFHRHGRVLNRTTAEAWKGKASWRS
jgi:hypothetical protein